MFYKYILLYSSIPKQKVIGYDEKKIKKTAVDMPDTLDSSFDSLLNSTKMFDANSHKIGLNQTPILHVPIIIIFLWDSPFKNPRKNQLIKKHHSFFYKNFQLKQFFL